MPTAVWIDFGVVVQLSAHAETRILVVENQTEHDVVLTIEQNKHGHTPMTVSLRKIRVLPFRRVDVAFSLNTSLPEGTHSFGFRAELQPGNSGTPSADTERLHVNIVAKVDVRRPIVRLQTKHIELGAVVARTGTLERELQLINVSDVPVRVKAAVQQGNEHAIEVTVKPSNRILKPNGSITLLVEFNTDTSKGKSIIASTVIVAVGSSDNLLDCSCTGFLVEPCVALRLSPRVPERAWDQAFRGRYKKWPPLCETVPLASIDVAEIGRPQEVNGTDGRPLFSVLCSSIYFSLGSTKGNVTVRSHQPKEIIECFAEVQGYKNFVPLRCEPAIPFSLGPRACGRISVLTRACRAASAGIGGTLIVSGACRVDGRDISARIVIPIGGALIPEEIDLPDVQVGETSSVGLLLANHSVANTPFRFEVDSRCLKVEPHAGDLKPGQVVHVDVTYMSDPHQPAGQVKGLQITSGIGGCPKMNVPVRVRAGNVRMALSCSSVPRIHVDLSDIDIHRTQATRSFLKLHKLALRVKNIGDVSAALTRVAGEDIAITDFDNATLQIQPSEERELKFDVAIGSLVESKREFQLWFGSFHLECALKTKIDGPTLEFDGLTHTRHTRHTRKNKFKLTTVDGNSTADIGFFVANRGNRPLKYRLVDAVVLSGGTAKVRTTLGDEGTASTSSLELKSKYLGGKKYTNPSVYNHAWRLHVGRINAGPLGVLVTFEAETATSAPDGEVLPTCRHSSYFSGDVDSTAANPELRESDCDTPHECRGKAHGSDFVVYTTAFVRLAASKSMSLQARAMGMPLAACSLACNSKASRVLHELDKQPENKLAALIANLDASIVGAALGGAAVGATFGSEVLSAVAARGHASAAVLAGTVLDKFSPYLARRSMLLDLALKLLLGASSEDGAEECLETCDRFLSLDACRPRFRAKLYSAGTPTRPCWARFCELIKPQSSNEVSRMDLSSRVVGVLFAESKAAVRLQSFFTALRNLTSSRLSGANVWAPLAADLQSHLDETSQALFGVCAERALGSSKWIAFISSLALKGDYPSCAPAIHLILRGKANMDTVLQVATSFCGGSCDNDFGSRGKLRGILQGLTALRMPAGTPLLYTEPFLRACGGGLKDVADILGYEFNGHNGNGTQDTLARMWEFLSHGRTDLTNAIGPFVQFLKRTKDAETRLQELTSDPTSTTGESEVVVEKAAELLGLAQLKCLEDMIMASGKFLNGFASDEEKGIIRRRQKALLNLHKLLQAGSGITPKETICSAIAKVAFSSSQASFAKWIQDVGSSTSLGDYSVAAGVGVLRQLTSVRQIRGQNIWVCHLVDFLDKLEVFRKGGEDKACGIDVLKGLLQLVQSFPQHSDMQDLLKRITTWVDFCERHDSAEKRLLAYVDGGGVLSHELEELQRLAREFNATSHPVSMGMDNLLHVHELYTTLMKGPSQVVSKAMPLMHAVYLLQNRSADDSLYQTAFASFLAVVSLLQLEKGDLLCVDSSECVSAASPAGEVWPSPPCNEAYETFPPAPPTFAEDVSGRSRLDQDQPVDDRGANSTLREVDDRLSDDVCDYGSPGRSGLGTAEGNGSGSACGGHTTGSFASGTESGLGPGSGGASCRSPHQASRSMPTTGVDADLCPERNSRPSHSAIRGGENPKIRSPRRVSGSRGTTNPQFPPPVPREHSKSAVGSIIHTAHIDAEGRTDLIASPVSQNTGKDSTLLLYCCCCYCCELTNRGLCNRCRLRAFTFHL